MTSRAYGCGSIEQRGGRFRARASVNGRRTTLGTFATEDEARGVLDGLLALKAAGDVAATGHTLRSYGAKWLDRRETHGHAAIVSDRSRWERYIAPEEWAGFPLAEIARADVRDWLDRMARRQSARGGKLSPQTILHTYNLVLGCLTSAVADELVERNVAEGLKLRRPRPSSEMWTYLLPEEQARLATCELPDERHRRERLIALVAMGTGLRQGELWNLELRDVHADAEHPWLFVRWGSPGKAPKGGRTRRVPLFGIALAAMREWLAALPSYASANPHRLAFPTSTGCRRQKSKLPRTWPAIVQAAGLVAHARHDRHAVRWHDLRHTCASSLVAGWWGRAWSLQEVREVLGHSSVTVTERYAHLSAGVLSAAAAATQIAPTIAPSLGAAISEVPRIDGRARRDSNARPSASEAQAIQSDDAEMAARWDALGAVAERYLRALETRSRHVHTHGVELAEMVLELTRGFSIPAVLFPSGRKDTRDRPRGGGAVAHLQQQKRRKA